MSSRVLQPLPEHAKFVMPMFIFSVGGKSGSRLGWYYEVMGRITIEFMGVTAGVRTRYVHTVWSPSGRILND